MECSSCGAELSAHETRCPVCGKPTIHYHRQRRCLHCGTPAAERAKTCLMCGQPIDNLPLSRSLFGGSWLGIGLGILIIVGIVFVVIRYQGGRGDESRAAAQNRATSTRIPTITPTPGPTNTPTSTATHTPTPRPTPRTHIIQSGENPSYIADSYGVTVDELIALNNIEDVRALAVGQLLLIPASAEGENGDGGGAPPAQIVYVVQSGDTLLDIALRYDTTVDAISAVNPEANLDLIFPGQSLVVPLATPTPTATPTATLTPTPTSGPPHLPPALLTPPEGQVVTAETLLFNWTTTGLLADDEFYVLQLSWPDGSFTEHWTQSSGWRISKEQRPAAGPVNWTVTIMRQTGTNPDGALVGVNLTDPGQPRTVEWP